MTDEFLKMKEVAELLKVSVYQVSDLIHAGKLKAVNVGLGKTLATWRISRKALDEFVSGKKEQSHFDAMACDCAKCTAARAKKKKE